MSSFSFTDYQTREAILEIYNDCKYIADPHGAVGYLGAKAYLENHPKTHVIFLETAHPTKFLDVVENVIQKTVPLPPQIEAVMNKEKVAIAIASYEELKGFLLK